MYIVVLNFSCSAKDREGHPEHAVHLQSTTYITQGCTSACARICIVATGRRWVVSKTETFSGERWLEAVCSSPRKNTTVDKKIVDKTLELVVVLEKKPDDIVLHIDALAYLELMGNPCSKSTRKHRNKNWPMDWQCPPGFLRDFTGIL